jgi:hypothetical protein
MSVKESVLVGVVGIPALEHKANIRLTTRRPVWLLFCSLADAVGVAQSSRENYLISVDVRL